MDTPPPPKPMLSVSALFDPWGAAYSRNRVTLIGTGFNYGPTQVLFGNIPAEINFVSATGDVIVCLTPEAPPSKVSSLLRILSSRIAGVGRCCQWPCVGSLSAFSVRVSRTLPHVS